jgi:hypothetical protein
VIELRTSDGQPLESGDLVDADVLGLTRPPLVQIGRDLAGGAGTTPLTGADIGRPPARARRGRHAVGPWRARRDVGRRRRRPGRGRAGRRPHLIGGPGNDRLDGGDGRRPDRRRQRRRPDRGRARQRHAARRARERTSSSSAPGRASTASPIFAPGDRIDLSAHPVWTGWGTLALSPIPDGTLLDLGGGDRVLLAGIDPASLAADDFLF